MLNGKILQSSVVMSYSKICDSSVVILNIRILNSSVVISNSRILNSSVVMLNSRIVNSSVVILVIMLNSRILNISLTLPLSAIMLNGSLSFFPLISYHHIFDVYQVPISLTIVTFIIRSIIGLQPLFLYFNSCLFISFKIYFYFVSS